MPAKSVARNSFINTISRNMLLSYIESSPGQSCFAMTVERNLQTKVISKGTRPYILGYRILVRNASSRQIARITCDYMTVHHEEREWFICSIGEYKGSKKGLRIHKESQHGTNTFKCDDCDYESSRNEYLKRHIKRQHSNVDFNCSKCEFSSKSKDSLRYHTIVHSNNMFFQCEKCDYTARRNNVSRQV